MTASVRTSDGKPGLHARNRHRHGYDFERLAAAAPELARFVRPNPYGANSIDYGDPAAVRALNRALLLVDYGLAFWDLPPGYLCPPIPGRADYVHHIADLLAADSGGHIPRGAGTAVLDIGVGANAIYPLLGAVEYGWRFVGTDIDPDAAAWANTLASRNGAVGGRIECRLQSEPTRVFKGVVRENEIFAATMCNPPFHDSAAAAAAGTGRKRRNLGQKSDAPLNFGGRGAELWCDGGEAGFVDRLIVESAQRPSLAAWFTTLVSSRDTLPRIDAAWRRVGVSDTRVIPMAQGQKRSRIVAWTFRPAGARAA